MYELILREIAVIDEALSIVCDRMNPCRPHFRRAPP